ncbi:hypothetical protein [Clostridium akagii]|uniref:hypothetical protein n=1 Tax=Clostridium akagii TaxID=91623 RepID=UPI00068B9ED8|nr:hypothetical protein [Clostridium akagii]
MKLKNGENQFSLCDNRKPLTQDELAKDKNQCRRNFSNTYSYNGHNTKLSEEDVLSIREMLKKGIQQCYIAEEYDISDTLVSNIKNKHRWESFNIQYINSCSLITYYTHTLILMGVAVLAMH